MKNAAPQLTAPARCKLFFYTAILAQALRLRVQKDGKPQHGDWHGPCLKFLSLNSSGACMKVTTASTFVPGTLPGERAVVAGLKYSF